MRKISYLRKCIIPTWKIALSRKITLSAQSGIRSFCTDKPIYTNRAIYLCLFEVGRMPTEALMQRCDSRTLWFTLAHDVCCHTTHHHQHLTAPASSSDQFVLLNPQLDSCWTKAARAPLLCQYPLPIRAALPTSSPSLLHSRHHERWATSQTTSWPHDGWGLLPPWQGSSKQEWAKAVRRRNRRTTLPRIFWDKCPHGHQCLESAQWA